MSSTRSSRGSGLGDAQKGFILVALAVMGYSFLPVFTNHLQRGGMEPLQIALWRFAITTPLFWGMSFLRAQDRAYGGRLPKIKLLMMGMLLAAAALCAFFGLARITAGTYVVIFYTYPAIVALISLVLGERLSLWGWAAILLTVVGVVLTAPDFSAGFQGDNLIGVLLALTNSVIVAVYYIVNARLLRGQPATARAGAWAVSGALIVLLIAGVLTGIKVPQGTNVLLLIGLAVISTVMPVFTLTMGIQKVGATKAAVFGTFEPLLTAFLAMILLGQQMLPIQWLGGVVIVASVILLQTLGSARRRELAVIEMVAATD